MRLVTEEPAQPAEPTASTSGPGDVPDPRPESRRGRRVLALVGVALLAVVAGAGVVLFERQHAYDRNIERLPDVFPADVDRPEPAPEPVAAEAAVPAQNWLLVGSDSRAGGNAEAAGEQGSRISGQRADTIILVHLPPDRDRVYLVSLPRDAWVPIEGHGSAKINAALAYGGPPLLISTVEQLTGVRIDHFAMVDFQGFELMTDALGGVDVRVSETVSDPHRGITWTAGTHRLDGEQALNFVRQRGNLPGGDLGRIQRQQAFLEALAGRVTDRGVLTNPLQLNAFLDAATQAVSVDESVTLASLRSLALELRSVRTDDIVMMTTPVAGTGREGGQSVVYLDDETGRQLFDAVRSDTIDEYVTTVDDAVNEVDVVR